MTLENKFLKNYLDPAQKSLLSCDPEFFAEMHLDNPFGQRIKGEKGCKLCKGKGYIKCRSGKHERGCKNCMMKLRIERSVVLHNLDGSTFTKVLHPSNGCEYCKGTGLIILGNKVSETVCPCTNITNGQINYNT